MSNQLEIEGLATDSNTGIYTTCYLLLATRYSLLATYYFLKPNHKSEVYRITSHNTALH